MVRYLSFDCANRTLAYSVINIDNDIPSKLQNIINTLNTDITIEKLFNIKKIINSFIIIEHCDVIDVIGDKSANVSFVKKTKLLDNVLDNLPFKRDNLTDDDWVVIEYQMNNKYKSESHDVLVRLSMYYAKNNVFIVPPIYKNKISYTPELNHNLYKEKYATINNKTKKKSYYRANKLHSKDNLQHFIKTTNQENILVGIKKKLYPDLADSIQQVLGYLKIHNCIKKI